MATLGGYVWHGELDAATRAAKEAWQDKQVTIISSEQEGVHRMASAD